MANKILSIAIPTYNMERYLGRCLDSLVAARRTDALEIIVVNDGSTDCSSEIAHRYAKEHPNSIIVIDKKNGNYGSCVNAALKVATGKYFRVLDSDDWVDTDGLVQLLDKLKNAEADAVVTHFSKEFAATGKSVTIGTTFSRFNETLPFGPEQLSGVDIDTDFVMHKLTYRTALLVKIGFHQTEGISYTDSEYVYYPLMAVNSIVFFDICLYRYFIGREGQSISIPSRIKHTDDMLVILMRIMASPSGESEKSGFRGQVRLKLLCAFLASYYWSVLVIQKLTPENNENLRSLDNALKAWDRELYQELDAVRCLGVKYIRHWRRTGKAAIPSGLYGTLRKIFKD